LQAPNEDLDFTKHAINKTCKLIKGVVRSSRRESFPEFTIDNALNLPVNLLDTPLCSNAQKRPRCKAEAQRRDQAESQCAFHNVNDPSKFVVAAGNDQGSAFREPASDGANGVLLARLSIDLNQGSELCTDVSVQHRGQSFYIASDAVAVGSK
jgi:hypothetical protein